MAIRFIDINNESYGKMPGKTNHFPLIGISVNIAEKSSKVHEAYINSVIDAGGTPIMIPATTETAILRNIIEKIDGLLLTGGADVSGDFFGEETSALAVVDPFRDNYDFNLLKLATDRQVPVFGICRGAQVINIGFGGTIWQDIPTQYPIQNITHNVLQCSEKPVHTVEITDGSILASILKTKKTKVNSRHHQAIKDAAKGFRISANSPDGIIEAIEAFPFYRIMGVQWHPENMASEDGNEEMKRLFRFFIFEAGLFMRAKKIHEQYLTVDSHCDTPMLFTNNEINIGKRNPISQVDIPKMQEGKIDSAFVVAYIPQGSRNAVSHDMATLRTFDILNRIKQQITDNIVNCGQAYNFSDAETLKKKGLKSIFLGLENGYAIGNNLENLKKFKDYGITYITLCHNGTNDICDSALGDPEHGGLSGFGKDVIKEMNRLGIAVDLSHASESSFYDTLNMTNVPVICSHSSARELCDHPRNLTNEQIRALAKNGGVIHVCLYNNFLVKEGIATIIDAANHIEHIIKIVGIDHVGIGSDFDGGGGIEGCNGINEMINITVELLRRGYGDTEIAKILGGNLQRVFDIIQNTEFDRSYHGS